MKLTGNTILITGGASGIGRGLAESFHELGNQVIIAGRRKTALDETTSAFPGMKSIVLDIADGSKIPDFAEKLIQDFPELNVLINNAGIMGPENLRANPIDLSIAEAVIGINLLGTIRLTSALLPHLQAQSYSAIMNVSSGLAFVPLSITPTYCATKAAIHSYTESLRFQLQGTSVEVLELIPPYVATDLLAGRDDPRAMPLDEFIGEVMHLLKSQPDIKEICVERVGLLRNAESNGAYAPTFKGLNEAFALAAH